MAISFRLDRGYDFARRKGVPRMEPKVHSVDTEALMEEIARLRGEVARLESRCDELDRLACHDTLVPVANRRGLVRQLDMLIARHARHGAPAALLFVDVDGLKWLNDSFGHAAGDSALIHLARLMLDSVRQSDLVARLGGDEFAILLDHADAAAATDAARRLVDAVAGSDFIHQGRPLPLSVAVGFTVIEKGDSAETVLDRADQQMYRDKAAA
jgi:diguanylate cyclase (GGDEF)-like protein